jgi:hypothetical protein
MSTISRDIRIAAIYDVGVKLDDALESAKLENARRNGAHAAYLNSAKNILAMLKDVKDPTVHDTLVKAATACNNLATQAAALVQAGIGAQKQAELTVSLVKQLHESEVTKRQNELDAALVKPAITQLPSSMEENPFPPSVLKPVESVKPRVAPRSIKEQRQVAKEESGSVETKAKRGRSKNS